jgi:hypothetical protein
LEVQETKAPNQDVFQWFYDTHGHKLRFPQDKKAQFMTECGITKFP